MRDPVEVIEQEIHNAGDAPIVAALAWRILAALRDEYGTWGPDEHSVTRWAPIIPVPSERSDG